jgi:outer membrane protein assembly factor BamA
MLRRVFIIISTCLVLTSVNAQDSEPVMRSDTLKSGRSLQLVGVPFLFYSPETSLGFGGGAQIFLLNRSNLYNSRLSNIFVSAVYTLNKQFLLDIKPQIYFGDGDYFLDVKFQYKVFPNQFWGVGNFTPESNLESYSMTSRILRIAFMRRLPPHLNFGFEYISENHDVTELEEGGLLDEGNIPGSDDAVIRGLGVLFNLDSRSSIESPRSGNFLELRAQFASKVLGSSHGYNKFIFDARKYWQLGKSSILAAQVYFEGTYGVVPFQTMATFGGGERARGYFRGRYIDNAQYVIQAEYRWRFKPRWVAAAFLLVGEVGDLPRYFFQNLKPSFGTGIRWQILKSQKTLVRLDVGIGKDGSNGLYFGVNEAF